MNWDTAIERHRQPLLGIVAVLYALIGLSEGGRVERLPWPLYRAVLAVLRPAESAVRRLIVVAARGLKVKPRVARPAPAGLAIAGKGRGRRCFQLFDPRGSFDGDAPGPGPKPGIRGLDAGGDPRVWLYSRPAPAAPVLAPPEPDDGVGAAPLCRRLAAIRSALKDLKRQARRYARWRAKALAERRPRRDDVLRPGPPPYLRREASHGVHVILAECHGLARAGPVPDSS